LTAKQLSYRGAPSGYPEDKELVILITAATYKLIDRDNRVSVIIISVPLRSIVKNLVLALLLLSSSIGSFSIAERSIAAPNNISKLKDGKYSACIKLEQPTVDDESQTCFLFIKQGSKIKGAYEITQKGPVICVMGTVRNNLITGSAYYDTINAASPFGVPIDRIEEIRRELPKSKLVELLPSLKVAQGNLSPIKIGENIKTNPRDYQAKITYKKATVDLIKFSYVSAVSRDSECLK
jgi:hypothetical protein